ncbi:MAG TPA: hypothetical protein VFJ52_02390 [Terriglobia bacterium]|nr:hypothetical protein [Terriglobia bacterium]HEX5482659.1 hypothetical protein [Terriglobia bacterium]
MKKRNSTITNVLALLLAAGIVAALAPIALQSAPRRKKDKKDAANLTNDATAKLFKALDESNGGKLDIYLLADVYSDPSDPSQQYQRVLHVIYNKNIYFGRFTIHVRSVGKMNSEQLATYSPQSIFSFGGQDTQEFEKINPGPFGGTGDLFLESSDGHPLSASAVTDDVAQEYEMLITKYIIPAVEKQVAAK